MATNLPIDIEATYPDASPGDATHQAHHDEIHAYTNSHDSAPDPHGDRAYADAAVAAADVVPYVKASGANYSIPASTFTKFAIASNVDNMSAWDATNSEYVVPEAGLYLLTGSLRVADGSPVGTQFGFGIHTATGDGTHFLWHAVQDTLGAADRTTYPYARVMNCAVGDRLRAFAYHEHTASLTFTAVEMTATRLGSA